MGYIRNKQKYLKYIHACRNNPIWWIHTHTPYRLYAKQREIVKSVRYNKRTAVISVNDTGKTFLLGLLFCWFINSFFPSTVITTSNVMRQVNEQVWAEIREIYRNATVKLLGQPLSIPKLQISPKHFGVGYVAREQKGTSTQSKGTGYHNKYILIIMDQASGLTRETWESVEGIMTSGKTRMIACSNPYEIGSEFANIVLPDRKTDFGKWNTIKITAKDVPNVKLKREVIPGLLSYEWYKEKMELWNPKDPMYQMMILAKFVDSGEMIVLSNALINSMFKGIADPDFDYPFMATDFAGEGLDCNAWASRAGSRLMDIDIYAGRVDTHKATQLTIEKTREYARRLRIANPKDLINFCDARHEGKGCYDNLLHEGYNVIPMIANRTAIKPYNEEFINRRAHYYWNLRTLAEKSNVDLYPYFYKPHHKKLIRDLKEELSIRYFVSNNGRIQLEKKKDLKSRIGRSPDLADTVKDLYNPDTGSGIDFQEIQHINSDTHVRFDGYDDEYYWKRLA